MGTIVGKYKGLSKGGFVVVEMSYKKKPSESWQEPKLVSKTETFEVPSNYYNSCKLGDTGIFPFKIDGEEI